MTADHQLLSENLDLVSSRDPRFGDRVYEVLFARHPELEALFGPHSKATKREMITETVVAALDSAQKAPWLDSNLQVLGITHEAAGVEDGMYTLWLECFVEVFAELSGDKWSDQLETLWRERLEYLSTAMKKACKGKR